MVEKRSADYDDIFTMGNEDEVVEIYGEVFNDVIENLGENHKFTIKRFDGSSTYKSYQFTLINNDGRIDWMVYNL